jgi:tRNA A-37 threonylcarbamoyl transferase component Bud32
MLPNRPAPGNLAPEQSGTAPPEPVTVGNGPATADADRTIAAALEQMLAHDTAAWTGRGFELVKERTVRRVLRGRLDGVAVYVKVFRPHSFADRARDHVRGGRGTREARHLALARSLGLPAVEPLAHGLARDGERLASFVATRAIQAVPFTPAMPPAVGAAVGRLVRRMHDLGLEPGDLHAGNLLVDAAGAVWLCDLSSLRKSGLPGLERRAAALAFLCNPLDGGPLDPAVRPLLDAYLDVAPAFPDEAFRQALTTATHRWRAAAVKSFGDRSARSCRHTEAEPRRRATPQWFTWTGPGAADAGLRDACRNFDPTAVPPARTGRRGGVWLGDDFVAKQRPASDARHVWRAAYWLWFAGVPSPLPIALVVHAGIGRCFTRRVPNVHLAAELGAGALDDAAVLEAARSIGGSIGRLHAHGLRNRDLKLENFVRDPATGHAQLVDLDGVQRQSWTDTRGLGRDLGRLLAAFRHAGAPGGAQTVRTFLRAYLRTRRRLLQRPPLRRLLRRAEQRAREWAKTHPHRAPPT